MESDTKYLWNESQIDNYLVNTRNIMNFLGTLEKNIGTLEHF